MTEFGFIESLRTLCADLPPGGFEGIGDDCACRWATGRRWCSRPTC